MGMNLRSSLTAGIKSFGLIAAFALTSSGAMAQFSDSYAFLKAVKDEKGDEVTKFIDEPGAGAVIINTRDDSTGEGALHIVVKRRDAAWTGFLLQKGANPNIADKNKVTPLMLATQLNFAEGVDWLLLHKADVNQANRSGETALILAVQLRNEEIARILLRKGANADKTDTVSGLSARDYAKRDSRAGAILALFEAQDTLRSAANKSPAAPEKKNGDLDFSGIK
jgi:uncharacterized protein